MTKFPRFWFPLLGYSGIIFTVSSLPNLQAPQLGNIPLDKFCHILEYTLFGFLLARAWANTWPGSEGQLIRLVVLATFVYGLSDEFHQSFVVGRSCSFGDLVADIIGGFLGSILFVVKNRRVKN